MSKKCVFTCAMIGLSALCLFPDLLLAVEQGSKYAGNEINDHATTLSKFLFGPVSKVAAVLGAGYAVIAAIMKSTLMPLIIFGAICLTVIVIPKFVDSVFTMIQP